MAVLAGAAAVTLAGPAGAAVGPRVSANVPVTATDLIAKTANNSPVVAADPTDRRFLALANRVDGPDFSCALQVSGDRGRTWVTPLLPKLPAGVEKCYAPEIAFDRRGTLYFLYVGLAGKGNRPVGAYLLTTSDRAHSFSEPWRVLDGQRFGVRMAIDAGLGANGRIHLAWLQPGPEPLNNGFAPGSNPILESYSDDRGRTFSKPTQVSDAGRSRVVAPALALGPNHAVHVLYYDLGDDIRDYAGLDGPVYDGTWSLVDAVSGDGGAHFRPGSVVEPAVVPPERVMLVFTMPPASIAVDRAGRAHVAWTDARNGDWDVLARSSRDAGRTWGPAVRVNDDPRGDHRHQYMPRLSVSPQGRIDVAFYDRRGNEENRGNDVYYSYSVNGGTTFARNVRLTSWDSDSMIGYEYAVPSATGLVEFGGRVALLSERARAVAAWADTRNDALGPPAQDIWAAEVVFPAARGVPLVPVAVTVAAFGVGAVVLGRRRRGAQPLGQSAPKEDAA